MENQILQGKTRAGDMVHNNQVMDKNFRNVSKIWADQCKPFSWGYEQIEQEKSETEDIMASVTEMIPTVSNDGKFVFRYQDGREFTPTEHAIEQSAVKSGLSTFFARDLASSKYGTGTKADKILFGRDEMDSQVLAFAYHNCFRRLNQEKKYLWRTRKDGSLRAMLTDQYSIIDNRWFLEILEEAIPNGLLSHWRGDSDTIWGNVLIPDSIREEDDSDYGGMVSVGNSEIGLRRISSLPSVFRAICMNGCIWDQESGKNINHVHKGKKDLAQLKAKILINIQTQIPLTTLAIDELLKARDVKVSVPIKSLLAQFSLDQKLSKKMTTNILDGYLTEIGIVPASRNSLFGFVGAITRAGQTMSNMDWVKLDTVAGNYVADHDSFMKLANRAAHLKDNQIEDCFVSA